MASVFRKRKGHNYFKASASQPVESDPFSFWEEEEEEEDEEEQDDEEDIDIEMPSTSERSQVAEILMDFSLPSLAVVRPSPSPSRGRGRPPKRKRSVGGRPSFSTIGTVSQRGPPPKRKRLMTIQERMHEIVKSRKGAKSSFNKVSAKGWEMIDFKKSAFSYPEPGLEGEFASIYSTRSSETSLLQIFLRQMAPDLVEMMLNNRRAECPEIWTGRKGPFRIGLAEVYKTLACEILITGNQKDPKESEKKKDKKALRSAFEDAQDEILLELGSQQGRIGVQKMEFIHAHFYLCPYSTEEEEDYNEAMLLCKCLLSLVSHLGQHVAGDEKVFHFTGNSQNVRLVESKREVGLWIYELTVRLPNGLPLLVYCYLHSACKKRGESVPVATVVKMWCDAIHEKGSESTILAFDSYYFSNATRECVMREKVRTVASVAGASRFTEVHDFVKGGVEQSGDFSGAYNKESSELYLYNWDPITSIGKKCIWSNTFKKRTSERGVSRYQIPGYDLYNCIFAICDNFNRALRDRTFPHRSGGGKMGYGEMGSYWNFIRSAILQNTINVFLQATGMDVHTLSYKNVCKTLSIDLFRYAMGL